MHLAFVIFERMTALDFIGVYDPLTRLKTMGFLPDLQWDVCALAPEVHDDKGLKFTPTRVRHSLASYQAVIVPGGYGTRSLATDGLFLKWLETARTSPLRASVGTGALLLGAAGFLEGRRATTHPSAFLDLEKYGAQVDDTRIVDEGDLVTCRGVTAAIDLGLHLAARFAGPEARDRIAKQMDYPYLDFCSCV